MYFFLAKFCVEASAKHTNEEWNVQSRCVIYSLAQSLLMEFVTFFFKRWTWLLVVLTNFLIKQTAVAVVISYMIGPFFIGGEISWQLSKAS